ncbi:MbcA/ParS/Xre antitoxin family protein [Pseudomonas fluorescens]|uniref:antitoxin Xre/MbcA/ParS toxin-binding domain-containing protein n=1 Tax=Pseudomonas fluorescens TaxID=294 RepID=UPI0012418BA4
MDEFHIVAFCPDSPLGCWSPAHRCFEGRRKLILVAAIHVLGAPNLAVRWLQTPARGLSYRVPCRLLSIRSGYQQVDTLLSQLEYGVYI